MMPTLLDVIQRAILPTEFAALLAWTTSFYPFQRRWLLDPCRFAIANKARQIGYSHATAAWATMRAAFLGETTTIISVGEREGIEVLEKATKHAQALERLGSRWAKAKPKGTELHFASGGRVIALPASSGGRSFSGNVVLDEFAYHEGRASKVWDSAAAVALHGYSLRIISTPNGVGNLFHTLWTDERAGKGYSKHQVDVHEAIADGMGIDLEECWKIARGDPRVFSQIFLCSFLDGEEQYIPTEWITRAIVEPDALRIAEGDNYAGLDIGLTHDLSSLVTVRQNRATNKVAVQNIQCFKRTDWDVQQTEIEKARDRWDWRRLCVDETGLGKVPTQLLQRKFGRARVEPVTFGLRSKEELATTLYQAFADRMLLIPNDQDLVSDLCALKRIITSTGAVRYDADRTDKGHADRAWALALALIARSTKPGNQETRPLQLVRGNK